jgi:2-keto-4-pentenoate hydratase/2-oxohepta-3-ene-1,7-dioic acid hydratase in catechol pathway
MMFAHGGKTRLGVVQGEEVVAVAGAGVPDDLAGVIAGGDAALAAVEAAAASGERLNLADVTPALPLAHPGKFICVGLNYALHAKEGGHDIPTYPSFFPRYATSLVPAGGNVIRPKSSVTLDYECELAFIIGKGGRHISEADALDHVFGYTLFNDVSVREYQRKTSQWTPGKNFDGTGPFGPVVVTPDELPPGASGLRITTRVNGETMQDSNTEDMIFTVANIIATLSEFMTLEPGDVVATGTPSGVAHARKPPAWMKAGDVVEVEVEKIGVLRNPVVDEA